MHLDSRSRSHSRASRAALMATFTKVVVVLFQLTLAAAIFHEAQDSFERQPYPCVAMGTGVEDAAAEWGDPIRLWRRCQPPPSRLASRLEPTSARAGRSGGSPTSPASQEARVWL